MPKLPRIRALDAEKLLLDAGFILMRSKGSHRIYFKGNTRVVIPFHGSQILHPKIIKQVFQAIEASDADRQSLDQQEKIDRFNSVTQDVLSDTLSTFMEDKDLNNSEE